MLIRARRPTLRPISSPSQIQQLNYSEPSPSVLVHIGLGEFTEALQNLDGDLSTESSLEVPILFNRAMAQWGKDGLPQQSLFERFLNRFGTSDLSGPNAIQCVALASWVVGDLERAKASLLDARAKAYGHGEIFSCWSYLELNNERFLRDLDAMARLFEGETLRPGFMTK